MKLTATQKKWIVSTAVTFTAAFLGSIAMQLNAEVPVELSGSFVLGVVSVAFRSGVKVLIESVIASAKQ